MSVYRRHKEKNFTCIDNHLFNDNTLSMKAKGLLAQILSLPDDWKYSVNGLASLFSDGRDAVNGAINELIEHGYIIRTRITNEFGAFDGYQYDIYEKPQTESGKIADIPFTENPFTENPFTENPTVSNTNISNTKVLNTKELDIPPISPVDNRKALFKQFWDAYPRCKRKVNYDGCERIFIKIENLEAIFPDIMASLEVWKREWAKENNEYVPMTHKWISQRYWEVKDMRTERQQVVDDVTKANMSKFIRGGIQ